MSKTNLNALIREVVTENPEAQASKLAHMVAERTELDDLRLFYATALEPLVHDVIRQSRNRAMNSPQGRSPKVEERRSWWTRLLAQRVHVGESRWKPLGDCGVDDLEFCIGERRDQVGALLGQIAKFEAIRDALVAAGVERVAELPEGAVEL